MQEGLLWYDNDPNRALGDKIDRAAKRYQSKLHHKPTVCYINVNEFEPTVDQINGIHLKPAANVLPHHLWIGVEQELSTAKAD